MVPFSCLSIVYECLIKKHTKEYEDHENKTLSPWRVFWKETGAENSSRSGAWSKAGVANTGEEKRSENWEKKPRDIT